MFRPLLVRPSSGWIQRSEELYNNAVLSLKSGGTRSSLQKIFYTSAQDTKRYITTHAVTVKCHQVIQLSQLPLMRHSEGPYNSDTGLLPPYH